MRARACGECDVNVPLIGFGQVRHVRLRPVRNAFAYRTYFLMLPLRQMRKHDGDHGMGALARNRFGLLSFFDSDHGDGRRDCLEWLDEVLAGEELHDSLGGEVWLHTYPRVLGYAFKPVSFWYCHRDDGSLGAIVVEVNNTFGERHCYVLHGRQLAWGREIEAAKVFHVSPFCAVRGRYRFRFMRTHSASPAHPDRTVVRIDHDDELGPLLQTSVSGELEPLNAASARRALLGMPLMTLAVIARIHWQALRLWAKRVPFFRKPASPRSFISG